MELLFEKSTPGHGCDIFPECDVPVTTLPAELARKAANYQHTAGTKIFTLTTTFNPGEATGAITEAGVCNASSGGTFIDRVTFAVVNKAADDTVTMNFQFTLS